MLVKIVFIAGNKSTLSTRVIGCLRESSVHSKVTDDSGSFAMIMSEFKAYEEHKQVSKNCV